MNYGNSWKKIGDQWAVSCATEQQPGAQVVVVNRAGQSKTVTLGDRLAGYGFTYAVAPAPRAQAESVGDMGGVLRFFAASKAKRPAVELTVTDTLAIRLNVAGAAAKVPGSITVCDAAKDYYTGERDWLGRVLVEGTYQPSRSANGRTEAIAARLRAFAADPAKVAAEYGHKTGRCCFCNLPLGGKSPDSPEGKRSILVGYGRKCARNFNLPW